MTRIERIMMILKYHRGVARLWVSCTLGNICMKLNNTYPKILIHIGLKGIEDLIVASKWLDLNKKYEKLKQIYDAMFDES